MNNNSLITKQAVKGTYFKYEPVKVHRFFERAAILFPNNIALRHNEKFMKYNDLEESVTKLSRNLINYGAREGDIIAIRLDRGFNMIQSILSCLKIGCPYLAIDTSFPNERIEFMIKDCSPRIIITEQKYLNSVKNENEIIITIEELLKINFQDDNIVFKPEHNDIDLLDNPMYIIYTSGTTGKPKGIIQSHRAITNLIQWQNTFTKIDFSKSVLQFSSFGFDVYLQELFSTFTYGGTLCLVSQEERIDGDLLRLAIKRHEINVIFISVSVMAILFNDLSLVSESITDIITAGEQLLISTTMKTYMRKNKNLRLHNHYGVSESHVVTSITVSGNDEIPTHVPIGTPIANVSLVILDKENIPVIGKEIGEIWISGDCLAIGYLNLPEKTANSFQIINENRWYKTGDFGYWQEKDLLVFQGRQDDQVKISGHLVVLSEIESKLLERSDVKECVVVTLERGTERRLAAHLVVKQRISIEELKEYLSLKIPDFMVPSYYVFYEKFPQGATGKVDRKNLKKPELERLAISTPYATPNNQNEQELINILAEVLGLEGIGILDNFSTIGLTSLSAIKVSALLSVKLNKKISAVSFFKYQTVKELIESILLPEKNNNYIRHNKKIDINEIAVIGMAGVFPSSNNIDIFWKNIVSNVEMLSDILNDIKVSPLIPTKGKRVPKAGIISNAEMFDSKVFGISNNDALWMDPQHRKFLEIAWSCFEDASIDPSTYDEEIGVFAGCAESTYLFNVQPYINNMVDYLAAISGTDKDFLATRVAYHLGLRGIAVNVQSACSTGLLAVHQACLAIKMGECDIALAGAASIIYPQDQGFPYSAGAIFSEDGFTRSFDKKRQGTNLTNAVAAVLLKPLKRALEDGDNIYAVISGIAANNDGANKMGFAAPSVEGQKRVVLNALKNAGVQAESISFIETHGTATNLGDQIELDALNGAYKTHTNKTNYCGLTSVKSRIGHTNRAAGIVGLICAVKSLNENIIPAIQKFSEKDPNLDFEDSPFYLISNTSKINNKSENKDIYAGVSSFGIGGTNVHAILKSYNKIENKKEINSYQLILLSASDKKGLMKIAENLKIYLIDNQRNIADVAKTLAEGRQQLKIRDFIVTKSISELITKLDKLSIEDTEKKILQLPKVAFIVPGLGVEHFIMGQSLYKSNEIFRNIINEGCSELNKRYGHDLVPYFLGEYDLSTEARFSIIHSILLMIEVSIGRALIHLGINPHLMLGLSGGEFACACIADCITYSDAIYIVYERGRLMDEVSIPGIVLSVGINEKDASNYCKSDVFIGGINSRRHSLIAGTEEAMQDVMQDLERDGVDFKRLKNKNPNHTPLMQNVIPDLRIVFENVKLSPPQLPFVSSATGKVIKIEEATSINYWCEHICLPIQFAKGLDSLIENNCNLMIELGPRDTMCQLGRAHFPGRSDIDFIPALGTDNEEINFLTVSGKYWKEGGNLFRNKLVPDELGKRLPLPTYPFEGERFWLDFQTKPFDQNVQNTLTKSIPSKEWIQTRLLKPTRPLIPQNLDDILKENKKWNIVGNSHYSEIIFDYLTEKTTKVKKNKLADNDVSLSDNIIIILDSLETDKILLDTANYIHKINRLDPKININIRLISFEAPEKNLPINAAYATLAEVISLENTNIDCRHLIFQLPLMNSLWIELLIDDILSPIDDAESRVIMYSGRNRFIETFQPLFIDFLTKENDFNEISGVYVLIGGMGSVGFAIAKYLLLHKGIKVAILGRTALDSNTNSSIRIQKQFQELQEISKEIIYIKADVTNESEILFAFKRILSWAGEINKIFHLAANIDSNTFLTFSSDLSQSIIQEQLQPKANGFIILNNVLGKIYPDKDYPKCIAFSSVSILLGGLGYSTYTYANRRLTDECIKNEKWNIIHWDVWANNIVTQINDEIILGSSIGNNTINAEIAIKIINLVIRENYPEIAVLTVDPQSRINNVIFDNTSLLYDNNYKELNDNRELDSLTNLILNTWSKRLAVDNLTTSANFIDFGGDSLTAIRVSLDLRESLKKPITPALLLRNPNFLDFRDALLNFCQENSQEIFNKNNYIEGDWFEVSPLQARWYQMHSKGFGQLIMPVLLEGEIELDNLERSISSSINKFDALRMIYKIQNEKVLGKVLAENSIYSVETKDLSNISTKEQHKFLKEWFTTEEENILDIYVSPPSRGYIFKIKNNEFIYVFHTHHICFDGWSATVLLEEIISQCLSIDRNIFIPKYIDIATWARDFLKTDQAANIRSRWQRLFENSYNPTYPIPDLEFINGDLTGLKESFILSFDEVYTIKNIAKENNTTSFTIFISIFSMFLSKFSETLDVTFGTTIAGRSAPQVDDVVGVFVNPLPIRLMLEPIDTIGTLIDKVSEIQDLVQSSQSYPLIDLIENLPSFHGKDLNETFRSYILYQNFRKPSQNDYIKTYVSEPDDVSEHEILSAFSAEKVALMRYLEIIIFDRPNGELSINFWYRSSMYSRHKINEFIEYWQQILKFIVNNDVKTSIKDYIYLMPQD